MELLDFHHFDGRPVSFERTSVVLMEPHSSGDGTFVRLGPIERPHDLHLREIFATVQQEVKMSAMERAFRNFTEGRDQDEGTF